ncbi:MAG: hypothetical protein ACI90V_008630, partial [Bacillariaceae sp.]
VERKRHQAVDEERSRIQSLYLPLYVQYFSIYIFVVVLLLL